MKENNREKGGRAELMTARWIQKYKGYCVLARNYSRKTGEIDIIARTERLLYLLRSSSELEPIAAIRLRPLH